MKTFRTPRILAAILAVSTLFAVPACKSPTVVSEDVQKATPVAKKVAMTASAIEKTIAALPASLKADVADAIAKSPTAVANLETVANGVESLATDAQAHPLPATLQSTVVGLAELVPGKIGAVATGVATAYTLAYPLLKNTDNALVGLGEFIRAFEPPKTASSIATSALAARLSSLSQMAYDVVLPRRHGD